MYTRYSLKHFNIILMTNQVNVTLVIRLHAVGG